MKFYNKNKSSPWEMFIIIKQLLVKRRVNKNLKVKVRIGQIERRAKT